MAALETKTSGHVTAEKSGIKSPPGDIILNFCKLRRKNTEKSQVKANAGTTKVVRQQIAVLTFIASV
jgi:hypothetical protein